MFVRNTWYVAAASDEIVGGRPFGRTIVNEPMVFYRTKNGLVSGFEDRCPHRRMPLSAGRVTTDDSLVCAYHGLTFNSEGQCILVPGQETPPNINLTRYPVEERWGFVWVWMGDPALADPDKIFDCSWLVREGWRTTRLYRHAKANYMLLNDNLSDLLHVAYLHQPSGGGNEHMGPAKTSLTQTENGFHFVRETLDIPSPPSYGKLANARKNVDRWHIADFSGPSFYRIHTGVAETGSGGADSSMPVGEGRWTIVPHHLITPETEQTTHYYQVLAHEWSPTTDSLRFLNSVIDEDVWAIEQQQRNIDARPDSTTTAISSDYPMLAMHRIVQRMLDAEKAASAVQPA